MHILLLHFAIFAAIAVTIILLRWTAILSRLLWADLQSIMESLRERWNRKRDTGSCRYCLFGRTEPAVDFATFFARDDNTGGQTYS